MITVWDLQEMFDRFREDKLVPTLREVRGDGAVTPEIKATPSTAASPLGQTLSARAESVTTHVPSPAG